MNKPSRTTYFPRGSMSRIKLLGEQLNVPQSDLILGRYVDLAAKLEKHKGRTHATKLLKEYYNSLKSCSMGCIIPNSSTWSKTSRRGLQTSVERVITPLDLSNDNHARWLLSLFSLYETWKSGVCLTDLETLTSQRKISWNADTIKEFRASVKASVKMLKRSRRVVKLKPALQLDYLSLKGGPCGQATLTAHHDASKLLAEGNMVRKIDKLRDKLEVKYSSSESFYNELKSVADLSTKDVSRVPILKTLAIPDKGPKVRTITIGNYYLQKYLRGVHQPLMGTLRNIPEDGTYQQDKAAQAVKAWTDQGYQPWCFDLTSATDLFPVIIQYIVMSELYPELAREWYSIMRKAKSYDITRQTEFEFNVGQPMGLYSSWAAFAITHHCLIRFAFRLVKEDFRENYYIIGDDVAILNSKAAVKYEELITGLGVPISKSKSITPYNKVQYSLPSAELAKRYFRRGVEITPVRPYDLDSLSGSSYPLALEFLNNLHHRWGREVMDSILTVDPVIVESPFLKWVDKVHRKKLLLISLKSPLGALLGGVTVDWWPKDKYNMSYLYAYKTVFGNKVTDLVEKIHYISTHQRMLLGNDTQPEYNEFLNHPLHKSLTLLDKDIKNVYHLFNQDELGLQEIYALGINLELAISMIKDGKTYRDYKSLRLKRSLAKATATLDVWATMTREFGYKPKDDGYPQVGSICYISYDPGCYDY